MTDRFEKSKFERGEKERKTIFMTLYKTNINSYWLRKKLSEKRNITTRLRERKCRETIR